MSVTFNVSDENVETVECPKCGAKYPETLDNGCDETMEHSVYGACYGMGFTLSDCPSMNLANGNARELLSVLGFVEEADSLCGSLEPSKVLTALAVLESDSSVLVSETRDNQGIDIDANGVRPCVRVIACGRSPEQVSRYISRLREIATIAQSRGSEISFG